ncbi:MAG: indoleacetamide hydrolase [Pseudomonadota bacterium]
MTRRSCLLLSALLAVACTPAERTAEVPEAPDIAALSALLDDGTLTSEALVRELLTRIDAAAALNAFITVNDEALQTARERDRQRRSGQVLGPLHGIPLVIKDNIHVAGLPNTAGTPGLEGFVPGETNRSVGALQRAGAIVLGKTNLHELAFGITSNNAAFGAVGNPRDPSRFAGGSSGGTAAAIAAGLAPAGLGTDTGGSVRIPAALTGIVGFRPSPGRYPTEAVTPISATRDTVGGMGRRVADIVLLDRVISGEDVETGRLPEPDALRLGICRDYYFANLETETAAQIDRALERLQAAGVTLVNVEYPELAKRVEAGFPIALYEARRDLARYLDEFETGIDLPALAARTASPDVAGVFAAVVDENAIPEAAYRAALADIAAMRSEFQSLFDTNDLDALVLPTTPLTARPIDGSLETVELNGRQVPTFPTYIRNTDPASLAGLPGISIPAGDAANGLPVGLELDGAPDSDRQLLRVALAIENLLR